MFASFLLFYYQWDLGGKCSWESLMLDSHSEGDVVLKFQGEKSKIMNNFLCFHCVYADLCNISGEGSVIVSGMRFSSLISFFGFIGILAWQTVPRIEFSGLSRVKIHLKIRIKYNILWWQIQYMIRCHLLHRREELKPVSLCKSSLPPSLLFWIFLLKT